MEASIKLGRIKDIPIGLHWSLLLVFGLLTWSLARGYFPDEYPSLPGSAHWFLAVLTSLLFFGSVLLHELGHALVALRNHIPVRQITLFIFGGVAQLQQETRSPGAEFRIAIAGPLVSLGLAGLFGGLYLLDQHIPYLAAPSYWLARINLLLALFNLIPGFPLDGGRVLRAIIWHFTGSMHRATQAASVTGQLVAFGFIGWGIYTIFTGSFFNGLWLAFIGWFLQNAAAASFAQTNIQEALRGIKVSQVMNRDYPTVPSILSLNQVVEEKVLAGGQRTFFVSDNGHPRGLLTLRDVTAVRQPKWRLTTVEQVMVPLKRLTHVPPTMELLTALQVMDKADVAQMPVVENDEVVGLLSRDQVLHYIRTRAELGI
ncbi:MAG: site-2 protease family protein [Anaerolineae bacterium]|nr:site-2 protease family protein [Anaerolineae bacterium]